MDSIRNGNFNSSEIVALTAMGERLMTAEELAARPKSGKGSRTTIVEDDQSFGDAAVTFITECNMERLLGRSITDEVDSNPLLWGKLLERYVHAQLGMSYEYFSDQTKQHPEIKSWVGTADFFNHLFKAIVDSKCPWTLKSFCALVDPWYAGKRGAEYWDAIINGWTDNQGLWRKPHPDAKKYYNQIVSNACIYGAEIGELIVFMPYKSELDVIRELANSYGIEHEFFKFWNKPDNKLPHLIDGGHYKNLNVFRFDIPSIDKQFLTNRVKLAEKKLIPVEVKELVEVETVK
jgi:hypothetical protein